jgi:hypothetical protein
MQSLARRLPVIGCALLLASIGTSAFAADYTDGPVVVRTAVRTVDGHFDDYVHWLDTVWVKQEEAAKKAGILTDYKVLFAQPRGPNDADIYLVEFFPNWAAFDGIDTKMDAISKQIWGSLKQASASEASRGKIRTILGSEVMQQVTLK